MGSPTIFAGKRTKLLTQEGLLTSVGRTIDYDGAVNYIANGTAEVNTLGWSTYALTESVTFQDTGDTVTLTSHGLTDGQRVAFTVITTTTGISTNTFYYVVNAATDTFQLADTIGGAAKALTNNGSGTMVRELPVNGSGGTANITWTRSTSSPLRGNGSYIFSKGAANYCGEGVACDFTIAAADLANVLQISFEYNVASGTYADDEVEVFIYDVTNGKLILPVSQYVKNVGINSKFYAVFQSDVSSTSYRLLIHIGSVGTTAFDLKIDDVQVGPQLTSIGPAMNDWQAYTPTIASGIGTIVSTLNGYWRRVGDSAEIQLSFVYTSGTGAAADFTLSIPSGLSIDSNKIIIGTQELGNGFYYSSGTGFLPTSARRADATSIKFTKNSATTFWQGTDADAAGTVISALVLIPIVGWSSNTVQSSDADTRVVACRAYRATNQTGVNPNASSVKINLDTVDTANGGDTAGGFFSANNRYVCQVSGWYNINNSIVVAATNVLANNYQAQIYKNGSAITSGQSYTAASGVGFRVIAQYLGYFAVGDYIESYLFGAGNNSSSTLTVTGAIGSTYIEIQRVSGPAVVQATENISCKYTSSTTTIGTTATTVIMPTKVWDTHSIYNTTTGLATIPVTGEWEIIANLSGNGASTTTANDALTLNPIVNGTTGGAIGLFRFAVTGVTLGPYTNGSCRLRLNAGDTVGVTGVRSTNVTSFSLSGSTASAFQLSYIGL